MEQPLSTEELIELIGVTTSNINDQFELWLTVTFAVIIASHLAGHRLSKGFRHLVASLYTAVSILLLLMLTDAVRTASLLSGEFAENFFSDPIRLPIAVLRFGVWILGTAATLVFIYKGGGKAQEN
jgi:hypothetical protein